jgi:hypothetical protein
MDWNEINQPPKQAGLYLICVDWMGRIEKAEFDGATKCALDSLLPYPTHWMPLPELPKKRDA